MYDPIELTGKYKTKTVLIRSKCFVTSWLLFSMKNTPKLELRAQTVIYVPNTSVFTNIYLKYACSNREQ